MSTDSDHKLVMMKIIFKWSFTKIIKKEPMINYDLFRNIEIRRKYKEEAIKGMVAYQNKPA